ncbi:MAG: SRPBCC domain-containing protein [Acidobacteria bacterium Pan2503]|uniref:SRPBCC domain-containing protein n=1 Tax=Candidatus Acidiferrum panamense TaxID=2741543 RepID=A0A7V8SWU9_9BACT|nr:SRPBCC domain-containing protein [Candidatus Acidoferrum panamensis]
MTLTLPGIESLSLSVNEEIRVRASLDRTFTALLEQLGPYNETPDGTSMPMKLESWPGGRWFRDLGSGNGHFWGVVQAVKKPTLLEIAGPLFMSYPVANNVQYRLREENGVTIIRFRHAGFGLITDEHKAGVVKGWAYIHENVRKRAETSSSKSAAIP